MHPFDAQMFINACTGLRAITRRAPEAGLKVRPRNTDLEALLEKTGLSGRARKV